MSLDSPPKSQSEGTAGDVLAPSTSSRRWLVRLFIVLAALLLLGAVGLRVWKAQQAAEGPVPIAWDKEACAHCRMHIGEPRFAAQAHLHDGVVVSFDDPGCLLRYLEELKHPPRALYFHHGEKEAWLSEAQVGFVEVSPTPMGYGLLAVERTTPGARSLEEVRALLRTRSKAAAKESASGGTP